MISLQRTAAGRAGVYHNGKRIGSVDRRDDGKWVPLTPDKEGWANPPQFPAFATRKAAAEALATGEVVY